MAISDRGKFWIGYTILLALIAVTCKDTIHGGAPQPPMYRTVVAGVIETPADPCSIESQAAGGAPLVNCVDELDRFDYYIVESQFGAQNLEDAVEIQVCESRRNPDAVGWAADEEGLFQMHPGWTEGRWNPDVIPAFDGFDPWANTWWASVLWAAEGWSQWTCARLLGIS